MIADQILLLSKDYSNKTLICYNNSHYSIGQINQEINSVAGFLLEKKIDDKYIGVKIDHPINLLRSIIAINRINKIPVIFSDYTITDNPTDIKIFLNDENIVFNYAALKIKEKKYYENDIQVALFTTGTTGKPKLVELTYYNVYKSSKMWNNILKFSPDDVYYNCLPLYHIGGLSIFFRTIYFNMQMIIGHYNQISIHEEIQSFYISLVPTMLYEILNNKDYKLNKIKVAILGGAHLTNKILDKALNQDLSVYVSYGMTETSSGIAGYWADKSKKHNCFIAHDNVDIHVDNCRIIIKSPTVMKGYYQDKKVCNKFITNDLAYIKNGLWTKISRLDSLIITGGKKVNPMTVEDRLLMNPNIKACKVLGVQDDKWGQKVIAFINEKEKQNNYHDSYTLFLKKMLPNYMVPKEFIILNQMHIKL